MLVEEAPHRLLLVEEGVGEDGQPEGVSALDEARRESSTAASHRMSDVDELEAFLRAAW